ncbi:unnamed protein product [Protopolystoma xenopodis]|uniref:Delta-aminolevulinic acid dehydratase n=1 Tax=Protopolystoma xenopodis TaxID=117903 RepID=A0A3S5B2I2_9PLAT|nr:unnamed protein product [Protopolystoma xenopodis]
MFISSLLFSSHLCSYPLIFPSFPCQIRDAEEGADMIMVKPGLPYLDVLADIRRELRKPQLTRVLLASVRTIWNRSDQDKGLTPASHKTVTTKPLHLPASFTPHLAQVCMPIEFGHLLSGQSVAAAFRQEWACLISCPSRHEPNLPEYHQCFLMYAQLL